MDLVLKDQSICLTFCKEPGFSDHPSFPLQTAIATSVVEEVRENFQSSNHSGVPYVVVNGLTGRSFSSKTKSSFFEMCSVYSDSSDSSLKHHTTLSSTSKPLSSSYQTMSFGLARMHSHTGLAPISVETPSVALPWPLL